MHLTPPAPRHPLFRAVILTRRVRISVLRLRLALTVPTCQPPSAVRTIFRSASPPSRPPSPTLSRRHSDPKGQNLRIAPSSGPYRPDLPAAECRPNNLPIGISPLPPPVTHSFAPSF